MSEPESPGRPPQVATGDRREEHRYERDDDQMVRVAHLKTPQAPLPRQEATTGAGRDPQKPGAPIQDVKVDMAESSVWDGRPLGGQVTEDVPRQAAAHVSPEVVQHVHEPPEQAPPEGAAAEDEARRFARDGRETPPFPPSELVSKRAGG